MPRPCLIAALPLSLVPAGACAQQAMAPDAAADPGAPTIIVTATRTPMAAGRVASSLTLLDKAAIDRAQDLTVADLLLRTPGISLSRNGGYGTNTALRIRGAEADQTVVVIDGVKLNDPASAGGGYNFANLLVGDASRIEILRGPQSTLWGAQAIGGVVNIVTPLPARTLEASFDMEAGSRETVSARAALGGRGGPLAWRIGAQAFTTAGISAIAPAFGGVERDGYDNRTVSGRATLDLAPGLSADVRGYYASGRADIDGTSGDTADYALNREMLGYAGLNFALSGGRLRNRLAYALTDTDRDNYNPARARPRAFDSAGRNARIEYQGSLAIAAGWDATFGIEQERSRFRSVSPPAARMRGTARITGVYGQVNGRVAPGLTLTGGLRHDDHDRYGARALFAGGAAWETPTGTVLRASYGEGFKPPTLYQLFSDYGDQALAPEQARGWDAGGEQRMMDGAVLIGASYFRRSTRDQISFIPCAARSADLSCATGRSGYYRNIARAAAQGIEAVASARIDGRLRIDGNYSWTAAQDRSPGATFGNWVPRRPHHAANASALYAWPLGLTTGLAVRWSGRAFDDAANKAPLAGYTLVDLRAEWALSPQIRLFARAENLFDHTYRTTLRYAALGRSLYAGMRGRF